MVQQLDPQSLQPDRLYPESDGKPLADNTIQFHLIMKIQGGIDALFADDPLVFVAGDLLWYPVEKSFQSQAPDVMVVFGRPKGDSPEVTLRERRAYYQWTEDNIPPQVAFEILSQSNTAKEMTEKFEFYQTHGIEEYYLYDPDWNKLQGWLRQGAQLIPIAAMASWVSPRLGIRFETSSGMLELYKANGQRFESYVETVKRAEREAQARRAAISRLLALGLTVEQVAMALGFSVEAVRQEVNQTL